MVSHLSSCRRRFPPFSRRLSLALDWCLEAPPEARSARVDKAARRLAQLSGGRPFTFAALLWWLLPIHEEGGAL